MEINMKIYFEKTNSTNQVIFTDGETAKIYDAAPSGIYEEIDLYEEDAEEQLRKHFSKLHETGEMNGYNDMYSENAVDFDDIAAELEENEATLIFEN